MLADVQRLLVAAVLQPDPRAFLQAQLDRAECGLSAEERRQLAAVGDDGLRLTRLVVRKLRLDRLLRGEPELAALCREQPQVLASGFAAYDAAVPPRAVFASEEAAQFARHAAGAG
ncbi:MAG TPA: hypothetical protein VFZ65_08050 [Planctomycetota bacterium]|nr:hypothetical protein [Planctomycetota bacterium]